MSITVHTPPGSACLRVAAAFACALGSAACNTRVPATAHTDRESATQAAAPATQLQPYPRATWRLAREQLSRVVLNVSHIAIRHEQSEDGDLHLRGPEWVPDARPTRSKAEAIAIATRIADALRGDPSRFAELASQQSEDVVTSASGGSLGAVPASRLPPEFLDAIASLRPGEVSRPIETAFGIHVLKLEETPPEQQLAASRIVIAYRDGGMSPLRPGRTRERSRAQALELAGQVAAEARAPGSDFAKLVERYSDSPDAAQAGDFGVWSTHSPKHRGFILQAIAAVPLGGITDPVDSNEGFQVLRRTAADAREHLAADAPVQAALVRLPTPSEPNLDDVLRSAHGPGLAHSLQLLRQTLFPTAPAEPARRALGELLQTAADDMSRAAPDERPAVLARFWTGAASILPEPEVQRLRAHVFAFARQQLMQD